MIKCGLLVSHSVTNSISLVVMTLPMLVLPLEAVFWSLALRRFSAALARPSLMRRSVSASIFLFEVCGLVPTAKLHVVLVAPRPPLPVILRGPIVQATIAATRGPTCAHNGRLACSKDNVGGGNCCEYLWWGPNISNPPHSISNHRHRQSGEYTREGGM